MIFCTADKKCIYVSLKKDTMYIVSFIDKINAEHLYKKKLQMPTWLQSHNFIIAKKEKNSMTITKLIRFI